jgi:hypothetical protein
MPYDMYSTPFQELTPFRLEPSLSLYAVRLAYQASSLVGLLVKKQLELTTLEDKDIVHANGSLRQHHDIPCFKLLSEATHIDMHERGNVSPCFIYPFKKSPDRISPRDMMTLRNSGAGLFARSEARKVSSNS